MISKIALVISMACVIASGYWYCKAPTAEELIDRAQTLMHALNQDKVLAIVACEDDELIIDDLKEMFVIHERWAIAAYHYVLDKYTQLEQPQSIYLHSVDLYQDHLLFYISILYK